MYTGESLESAIIVDSAIPIFGILREQRFLELLISSNEKSIKSLKQNVIKQNGKVYDKFIIILNDGTEKTVYFDITSFFGKFIK
jgi:hypothetical protein